MTNRDQDEDDGKEEEGYKGGEAEGGRESGVEIERLRSHMIKE